MSDAVDRQQHDDTYDDAEYNTDEHRYDDTCQYKHDPLQHKPE